jgi:hypothetical protein
MIHNMFISGYNKGIWQFNVWLRHTGGEHNREAGCSQLGKATWKNGHRTFNCHIALPHFLLVCETNAIFEAR